MKTVVAHAGRNAHGPFFWAIPQPRLVAFCFEVGRPSSTRAEALKGAASVRGSQELAAATFHDSDLDHRLLAFIRLFGNDG